VNWSPASTDLSAAVYRVRGHTTNTVYDARCIQEMSYSAAALKFIRSLVKWTGLCVQTGGRHFEHSLKLRKLYNATIVSFLQ
jgi:hypothetical protein